LKINTYKIGVRRGKGRFEHCNDPLNK